MSPQSHAERPQLYHENILDMYRPRRLSGEPDRYRLTEYRARKPIFPLKPSNQKALVIMSPLHMLTLYIELLVPYPLGSDA